MQRLLTAALLVVTLVASGCTGDDKATATTPAPTAPSSPQFHNMLGAWSGTLVIVASIQGQSGSNTCNLSWIVTGQSSGDFSGTFQASGGTAATCASAGTLTGSVSTAGGISNLRFNTTIGLSSICTRTGGDSSYSGVLSGSTLSAQASETDRCSAGGVTADGSRSLTISLRQQ